MKLSIGGVLTLIFVVLKLLGKISWSWWLVVSPLLVEVAIVVLALLFAGLCVAVVGKANKVTVRR